MKIQEELLKLMENNGPMTRDEFCEELCYEKFRVHNIQTYKRGQTIVHYHRDFEQYNSRTTVYDNLKKLLDQGLVERFSKRIGKVGRSPVYWRLVV